MMRTLFWVRGIGLGLLAFLCLSTPVEAHPKTDVITLYNGDRITGEIKSLSAGRLDLGTAALNNISIEWKEIASVESNYNYELRLNDGQRFFGSINPGSVAGTFEIEDVFGTRNLGWQEIVEIRPVEESIEDRIDLYVSANYAFTKASGVAQTELRATVSYETEDAINAFTSRATVSDTATESTASSKLDLSRQVWANREARYRLVFGGYETNDELALDYRFTLGGGVGKYFIDTNNSTFNGSFSVQALQERSAGGENLESLEGVLTGDYARWRFDTPELDVKLSASIYPSLTESGRVRADGNGRVRWELVPDLYWDVTLWGTYDNSAVDETAGEFDWGLTTGLGWEF